jgi:SAM-dependent methyltransferase
MRLMILAFRPDETSPLVDTLLAGLGIPPGTLDRAIDARDEMLGYLVENQEGDRERALFQYFRTGASIAGSIGQVLHWRFGDPGRIGKLLDFASGYGRVTRFLVREIPPERVWVADVYADGVRFQEERLGVHGIVSTVRPEGFSCAERFDAILVTSLFTHLPEERFLGWLRVLLGRLAPGGLLAFSVHSPEVLPPGVEMPASGFCFQETSESGSLDTRDYGSTWVTEGFVRGALERVAGPEASLHRLERGLCDFQDLYLAIPEPGVSFASLSFQGEPRCFVERADLSSDGRRLDLEGWAAVRTGAVRAVEVILDGERLAVAPVDRPRGDVAELLGEGYPRCGWACSCALPAGLSRSSAVLLLRVVDGRGVTHPVFAGSLDALLLTAARLTVSTLRRDLFYTEAALTEDLARAAVEAEALRARIAAMEASRFWKLRDAWFRVKRGLGLTDQP